MYIYIYIYIYAYIHIYSLIYTYTYNIHIYVWGYAILKVMCVFSLTNRAPANIDKRVYEYLRVQSPPVKGEAPECLYILIIDNDKHWLQCVVAVAVVTVCWSYEHFWPGSDMAASVAVILRFQSLEFGTTFQTLPYLIGLHTSGDRPFIQGLSRLSIEMSGN